jgi:hypothetical protein
MSTSQRSASTIVKHSPMQGTRRLVKLYSPITVSQIGEEEPARLYKSAADFA